LENENTSYDQLIEFIKSIGQRAKKPFREAVMDVSKIILVREADYYDDFYFFRNKVYSDIDSSFSSIDPLREVKEIITNMEFDLSKIHFHIEDRKNKNLSEKFSRSISNPGTSKM
jgi:hypothetical protein